VLLTVQQSYELLAKHGCYITEICDACGRGIGPVRFTRRGEAGVWCSRECRGGAEAHTPGTCKHCHAVFPKGKRRRTVFCDDACRKAYERASDTKLSRTKPSIYAAFSSGNSRDGVQGHPGAVSPVLGQMGREA
jgi:hypothetical protein